MPHTHSILEGDCLEVMKTFPDNHFSSIVTDPPYGLGFMGKEWDAGLPHELIWKEALRVVKPGGFLLAFGGTRTYHRLTCSIEDAGWEIRDCIMWLYGSGFPKSLDVSKAIDKTSGVEIQTRGHFRFASGDPCKTEGSFRTNEERQNPGCKKMKPTTALAKQFDGYGTALKPAYEPIIVAMKPLDGTFANNAEVWGQAGINIDGCRVGTSKPKCKNTTFESWRNLEGRADRQRPIQTYDENKGRWPANIILDKEAATLLDQQSGGMPSRYFYCAKASSKERSSSNNHPTVKPLALMEYLIKLVSPPTNALILDPFAGSGTTILAAKRLCISAIGIEKCPEYVEMARNRLQNGELF